jgi:hypothetical protein
VHEDRLIAMRANLFPGAHAAIEDWTTFRWHRYGRLPHSSQALAIDVFGALQTHPKRSELITAVLARAFPTLTWRSHAWNVRLELRVVALGEPTPTQLDALLIGDAELVTIESKFCEAAAGSCSQAEPVSKGPHKGLTPCNGNYEAQINPVSGAKARCALQAKGVRYWDFIPDLFDLNPLVDLRPCAFRDGKYQIMRNVVAAEALARDERKEGRTLLVYTDGPNYPMAKEVRDASSAWNSLLQLLKPARRSTVGALSYQVLLEALEVAAPDDAVIRGLVAWVRSRKLPAGEKASQRTTLRRSTAGSK